MLTSMATDVLTWGAALAARDTLSPQSGLYTDIDTNITFYGYITADGYRYGMVVPQHPTTDLIMQLVSPLTNGGGWGGVSLASSMVGPLLLVTWSDGDKVMTTPFIANDYNAADVVPFSAYPIILTPIRQGTFVNSTHVSSTFLCGGCINSDSFDPAWASDGTRNVDFGYAYSQDAVSNPSSNTTTLSDHMSKGGGYGAFPVNLKAAESDSYDKYAAMAGVGIDGTAPEQPDPSSATSSTSTSTSTSATTASSTTHTTQRPTATPSQAWTVPCLQAECATPTGSDSSHRKLSFTGVVALVLLGILYLVQIFQPW